MDNKLIDSQINIQNTHMEFSEFVKISNNVYYNQKNIFGKAGDFITSAHISNIFAEIIAISILNKMTNFPYRKINIIDMGAGDGTLISDILTALKSWPKFFEKINLYIIENSYSLQKIQKNTILSSTPNIKINFIHDAPNFACYLPKIPTFFFANEFFDALPHRQYQLNDTKWYQKYIEIEANKPMQNIWKFKTEKKIDGIKHAFFEYSPTSMKILYKIIDFIKKYNGAATIIDYGYDQILLEHDTCESIKKHKPVNIMEHWKQCDTSFHVNFALIKRLLKKHDMKFSMTSQKNFLINHGIIERAAIQKIAHRQKSHNISLCLNRLLNDMGKNFICLSF